MDKPKLDQQTGLLERSVNIQDYLVLKNIPVWGRPKGTNMFERLY